ncbi:hypothetical protein D3C72_1328410 [compost metagenome]
MLPQADVWSRLAAWIGVHARRRVNADIYIAVTTQGIGFAGEAAVLEGNALLTTGIQFTGQQLGFQCLDDLRESLVTNPPVKPLFPRSIWHGFDPMDPDTFPA